LIIIGKEPNEIIKEVEDKLRQHVPDDINLKFKIVDKIPKPPAGKQQCVISKEKVKLN
jgi:transcription elongation factor GreA-like protein